eukprot:COSAG05_NODE_140_length_16665_cov_48.470059_6_plen_64_part_00
MLRAYLFCSASVLDLVSPERQIERSARACTRGLYLLSLKASLKKCKYLPVCLTNNNNNEYALF